jgi:SAM-dependent methyltransferase
VRRAELLDWLSGLPEHARDAAIERFLGIDDPSVSAAPPGEELIGYHASGVASVVRALIEVPVSLDDVVVDLGAGLGKVVFLTRLLTGARARGIELQAGLVDRARASAKRLELDVPFAHGDVRESDIDDGTVFFLYLPFTGSALTDVVRRLHAVAIRRAIVVCALGVDLGREASWLAPRPTDSFWLTIYDSTVADASPRPERTAALSGANANRVAFEGQRLSK